MILKEALQLHKQGMEIIWQHIQNKRTPTYEVFEQLKAEMPIEELYKQIQEWMLEENIITRSNYGSLRIQIETGECLIFQAEKGCVKIERWLTKDREVESLYLRYNVGCYSWDLRGYSMEERTTFTKNILLSMIIGLFIAQECENLPQYKVRKKYQAILESL